MGLVFGLIWGLIWGWVSSASGSSKILDFFVFGDISNAYVVSIANLTEIQDLQEVGPFLAGFSRRFL